MNRRSVLAAAVLLLHGIIHLLGAGVYLGLFELATLEYETTLLLGAVDVSDTAMRALGLLWGVTAAGFAASAATLAADWPQWRRLLAVTVGVSLVITGLDVGVAYGGFLLNLVIAGLLVAGIEP